MDDKVELFPIRDLSLRTGVNSVTLRAWERRYGLLKPTRTPKGHRLYKADDVERVNQILNWINKGVPVSKVKALLTQQSPSDLSNISNEWKTQQILLSEALQAFQEDKIHQLYQQISVQYPAEIYIHHWLIPVLCELRNQVSVDILTTTMYNFLCSALIKRISMQAVSQKRKERKAHILLAGIYSDDSIWLWLQAVRCMEDNLYVTVLDNLSSPDLLKTLIENIQPDYFFGHFEKGLMEKEKEVLADLSDSLIPCYLSGAATWLSLQDQQDLPANLQIFSEPFEATNSLLRQHK